MDKKGETVTEAFKSILKEGRKPKHLWQLKDVLEKNGLQMYSTENDGQFSVGERWNRTMNTKMWKKFTVQGNTKYFRHAT